MDKGKIVFSQLMECLPRYEFQKCVEKYKGEYKVKNFSCMDQFLSMAFAQLTYRESLRDTVTSLESVGKRLYHMGIRTKPTRNNLVHANAVRERRIFQEFALILVERAIRLSGDVPLDSDIDLREAVYALVVILKRQLRLPQSPCTILQVLGIVIFEKDVIAHILTNNDLKSPLASAVDITGEQVGNFPAESPVMFTAGMNPSVPQYNFATISNCESCRRRQLIRSCSRP